MPPEAAQDENARRRGRTGLAFAAIFLTQIPIFSVEFSAVGLPGGAGIIAGLGLPLLLTPLVMRRSLVWGNRFVLGVLWLIMYGAAYSSGGPRGPSVYWTTVLPVMAMMTISVQESLRWLASIVVMATAYTLSERFGVHYTAINLGSIQLVSTLAVAMLGCVLFGLEFAYESARDAMVHEAERVNKDMRLVLENVAQGFVTITQGNRMSGMRSAIAEVWLGEPAANDTFSDWITRADPHTGGWMRVGC